MIQHSDNGYVPKRLEHSESKGYLHHRVCSSTVHNSHKLEETKVFIIRWGRYNSALKKNEILPFAANWTQLEDIILCERNWAQKYKYFMFSLLCESQFFFKKKALTKKRRNTYIYQYSYKYIFVDPYFILFKPVVKNGMLLWFSWCVITWKCYCILIEWSFFHSTCLWSLSIFLLNEGLFVLDLTCCTSYLMKHLAFLL